MSICIVFDETPGTAMLSVVASLVSNANLSLIFWKLDTHSVETRTSVSEIPFEEFGDEHFRAAVQKKMATTPKCFAIVTADPVATAISEAQRQQVSQIVLAGHRSERKQIANSDNWKIFEASECDALYVCQLDDRPVNCQKLLVPVSREAQSSKALKIGSRLASSDGREITAIYVEASRETASHQQGVRFLNGFVQNTVGASEVDRITQRVEVAEDSWEGLQVGLDIQPSILLMGFQPGRTNVRQLQDAFALVEGQETSLTAIAIARSGSPISGRVGRRLQNLLQATVPQLNREQRVALVEQVQSTSRESFDFTALMCLSTLIASLGLLLNSGSIIIGAMLVAPMMTPIVGAGLAVTQGNWQLFRSASFSVMKGFVLSFGLSFLVGVAIQYGMTSSSWPNSEMLARDSPNLLDLIVAFISGLVASYAMGRPNLVSALPGVAIAAALIPPIATAGMSLAFGNHELLFGALLLFLTNIVAIALATSISLRAIGIRDTHSHGTRRNWSRIAAIVLCVAAVVLAVFESFPRNVIPAALGQELTQEAAKHNAKLAAIDWITDKSGEKSIRIVVERSSISDDDHLEDFHRIAREFYQRDVIIELETRLVARTDSNLPPSQ